MPGFLAMTDHSLQLGPDLMHAVLSHLDDHVALTCAAQVSKQWHCYASDDSVWQSLYSSVWPHSALSHQHGHAQRTAPPGCPTTHSAPWSHMFRWKIGVQRAWQSGARWCVGVHERHTAWVNCVRLLQGGARVVSGGADHALMLWEACEAQPSSPLQLMDVHSTVYTMDVAGQHSMQSVAAVGTLDGPLQVWDLHTGVLLSQFSTARQHSTVPGTANPAASVQLLEGGSQMLSAHCGGRLLRWDLRAPGDAPPATPGTKVAHGSGPCVVQALSMAGQAGSRYNSATGALLGGATELLGGGPHRPASSAHLMQGHCLVAGDGAGRLHVYDTRSCSKLARVQAHRPRQPVFSMAGWEGGGLLATGGLDGAVKVWRPSLLTCAPPEHDYTVPSATPHSMQSGPGGPAAAAESCSSGALVAVGGDHSDKVYCVAMSEEGRLASVSEDSSLRVWDAAGLPSSEQGQPRELVCTAAWAPSLDDHPQLWPHLPQPTYQQEEGLGDAAEALQAPEPSAAQGQLMLRVGCPLHGCDIAETCVAVGGRDALVRVYSVDEQRVRHLSRLEWVQAQQRGCASRASVS